MKKVLIFPIVMMFFLFIANNSNAQKILQSISIEQVDTFALRGFNAQPVLRIQINVTGNQSNNLPLEKIVIKSLNEYSTETDSFALYYTRFNRFSLIDYPGEARLLVPKKKPSGDTVVFDNFSLPLDTGVTYIFVTMDVLSTARPSRYLDASIRKGGIKIAGEYYPASDQSPTGNVRIYEVYYKNNFESYSDIYTPVGWQQELQSGSKQKWRRSYGGYGIGSPPINNPSAPKSGKWNIMLQRESDTIHTTILRLADANSLDLSLAAKPTLSFYHAQQEWDGASDSMSVCYKVGISGTWKTIKSYPLKTNTWVKRIINLPADMAKSNVYLGFKGSAQYGWGVCIDSLVIFESAIIPREVSSLEINHPQKDIVAQGSGRNPVLRVNIRLKGNNGTINLNDITFTSNNSSDTDVKPNGVKLYYTPDSILLSPILLGTCSVTGGKMIFTGLNRLLETGENYFWLTYDIADNAIAGNVIDAKINAGDIVLSTGGTYPSTNQSPSGSRLIKQTVFFEDFETVDIGKGWTLNSGGEFQIKPPQGLGGSLRGMADPKQAYSGANILGTDLTGLGANQGDYEPNLTYANSYTATSPLIDSKYFKNLKLSYYRWLNVNNVDTAIVEYKLESSSKWQPLWQSYGFYVDGSWHLDSLNVADSLDRRKFNIRFRLGPTHDINVYSGWNVDYLFFTGDSVRYDAAVTQYISPISSCDLTSGENIKVKVKNTGPRVINNLPIKYSLDNGKNYVTENISGPIAVDQEIEYTFTTPANFSKASIYHIVVKVALPQDEYPKNDSIVHVVTAIPTYTLPYYENFEPSNLSEFVDSSFWTPGGTKPSWRYFWPGGSFNNNSFIWKTDSANNSRLYEYSYMESPCFSFAGKEIPMMDLAFNYYTRGQLNGAILEYSLDKGQTWNYAREDGYNFSWSWYNDTVTTLKHKGWTGISTDGLNQTWINGRQILPSATAGQNKVKFRIVFKSDSSVINYPDGGFAFDDIKIYNAPYDIGVDSILNLQNNGYYCQFEKDGKLQVRVKNYGIRDMQINDTIIIGVKADNAAPVIDTFKLSSPLAKNATRLFTMNKPVNIKNSGLYKIKAYTLIEKELDFYKTGNNDTTSVSITIKPNPLTNLPDTVYSARPDTLQIKAKQMAGYQYSWYYGGSQVSTAYSVNVKNGVQVRTGNFYITVTDNNPGNGCITHDSVYYKLLVSDIGIRRIIDPVTNCGYGTNFNPLVRIRNFGTDTLQKGVTIPIVTRLNKNGVVGPVVNDGYTLVNKLAPKDSIDVNLPKTVDLSQAGTYTFMVGTKLPNDLNFTNDSTVNSFTIYSYPVVDLGPDVYIKATSYTLKLPGGYSDYEWNDGSKLDSLKVTTSGKYKVSVKNSDGCVTKDSVDVRLGIHDLMVKRLVSPQTSCTISGLSTVSCKLMNNGTDTIKTGETIMLEYSINGGSKVTQTLMLSTPIMPQDSIDFAFTQKQDMSVVNTYNMKLKATIVDDIRRENDSIMPVVNVYGNPQPNLGIDNIVHALSYKLDPGKEVFKTYTSYKWQDNSTDSTYEITQTHMEPSHTYSVTVTDQYGCQGVDTIYLYFFVDDIKLKSVQMPDSTCPKSYPESVYVKVVNSGNQYITNKDVIMRYKLNNEPDVLEAFKFTGAPNDSVTYKFITPLNLRQIGNNKLVVSIDMTGDLRRNNDTISKPIKILNGPVIDFGAANDTLLVDLPHVLDAGFGSGFTYNWSTGETTQNIIATNTRTEYTVTVTSNECVSSRKVYMIDKVYDLAVSNVLSPASVCMDTQKKALNITVMNIGTVPLVDQPVVLKYQLNRGTEKIKNVVFTGNVMEAQTYKFDDSIDVSTPVIYDILTSLEYNQDEFPINNSRSAAMVVIASPVVNFNAVNDSIRVEIFPYTLDAGSGAGYKYVWQDNSDKQTYEVNKKGIYSVTVSNGGCSTNKSVTVWNSIPDPVRIVSDKAKLRLYPVPAHEVLNIDLSLKDNDDVVLEFVSLNGKVITHRELTGSRQYTQTIDVTKLPRGLYYVRVYHKDWLMLEKVMLQ